MITTIRIVESGPGWRIVEADCGASMADGRMFRTPNDAKAFARAYGWAVDERWNREVDL